MSPARLAALTVAAVMPALLPPAAPAGTWYEEQTLEHDGGLRHYRYYVPDVQPPAGYQLLFVLHGGGGDMRSVTNNGAHAEWPEIADEEGILLIVPNGINADTGDPAGDDQNWNDCRGDAVVAETGADDVSYISALIDWAAESFPIDPARVYSTGASNGGMMSYRLAFELGDRIAAIAAYIANLPAVSECRPPSQPVPVFICNGDAEDDYMPWDGGCVKRKTSCERGTVLSAVATREFWIAHNHASPDSVEFIPHEDLDPTDGCTAESDRYDRGLEGAEVAFYRIRGGGHTTPSIEHQRADWFLQLAGLGRQNHDIEGARKAWAFLSRHTLTGTGEPGPPGLAGLLRVAKAPADRLHMSWAGDCGGGQLHGLYRGDLTLGYSSIAPIPGRCDVSGTEAEIDAGVQAAQFFLVVPNDGATEGAYGSGAAGSPRQPAPSPCLPQEDLASCTTF
jgi:polyhydroxybutyrate depolymerase